MNAYQMTDEQEHGIYKARKLLGLVCDLSDPLASHGNRCGIDREALAIFADTLAEMLPDSSDMPYSEIK
jgi:hypothetical protein